MEGLRLKSDENWSAAEACRKAGQFNAAASRLYYSVFQAAYLSAIARPVRDVVVPRSKEDGSKHVAMIRFVAGTGLGNEGRSHYVKLRTMREIADYEEEPITQERLKAAIEKADWIRTYCLGRATT